MKLVVLIPAYQAAATVEAVVGAVLRFHQDVVVVDDGSSDETRAAAERAGALVLRHASNAGKGAALRTGFAAALRQEATAVLTLDADGQHDPSEIPQLVQRWQETGAGIVIGSRAHHAAEMSAARRFGNRFSRRAISLFAGVPVIDSQSGFRLYDASMLRQLTLRGTRYELESEVIVKAARAGFAVLSVPIRLSHVDGLPTSHFRPWRDTARICVAVVWSWVWSRRCS